MDNDSKLIFEKYQRVHRENVWDTMKTAGKDAAAMAGGALFGTSDDDPGLLRQIASDYGFDDGLEREKKFKEYWSAHKMIPVIITNVIGKDNPDPQTDFQIYESMYMNRLKLGHEKTPEELATYPTIFDYLLPFSQKGGGTINLNTKSFGTSPVGKEWARGLQMTVKYVRQTPDVHPKQPQIASFLHFLSLWPESPKTPPPRIGAPAAPPGVSPDEENKWRTRGGDLVVSNIDRQFAEEPETYGYKEGATTSFAAHIGNEFYTAITAGGDPDTPIKREEAINRVINSVGDRATTIDDLVELGNEDGYSRSYIVMAKDVSNQSIEQVLINSLKSILGGGHKTYQSNDQRQEYSKVIELVQQQTGRTLGGTKADVFELDIDGTIQKFDVQHSLHPVPTVTINTHRGT